MQGGGDAAFAGARSYPLVLLEQVGLEHGYHFVNVAGRLFGVQIGKVHIVHVFRLGIAKITELDFHVVGIQEGDQIFLETILAGHRQGISQGSHNYGIFEVCQLHGHALVERTLGGVVVVHRLGIGEEVLLHISGRHILRFCLGLRKGSQADGNVGNAFDAPEDFGNFIVLDYRHFLVLFFTFIDNFLQIRLVAALQGYKKHDGGSENAVYLFHLVQSLGVIYR